MHIIACNMKLVKSQPGDFFEPANQAIEHCRILPHEGHEGTAHKLNQESGPRALDAAPQQAGDRVRTHRDRVLRETFPRGRRHEPQPRIKAAPGL